MHMEGRHDSWRRAEMAGGGIEGLSGSQSIFFFASSFFFMGRQARVRRIMGQILTPSVARASLRGGGAGSGSTMMARFISSWN